MRSPCFLPALVGAALIFANPLTGLAESMSAQVLEAYRNHYAQLLELGLRPADAAAEARRALQDDAKWLQSQTSGVTSPAVTSSILAQTGGRNAGTNATAAASSPKADTAKLQPQGIVIGRATARQLIRTAKSEIESSRANHGAQTMGVTGDQVSQWGKSATLDAIVQIAQTNRLTSASSALLKNLDALTNLLAQAKSQGDNNGSGGANPSEPANAQAKKREQLEKAIAKETEKAAENLETVLTPNKFTPKAFLHVGYVTLNPYQLASQPASAPAPYRLEEGSASSTYVEFQYNNRWAWNWNAPAPAEIGRLNWVSPFSRRSDLDLQGRFGYSFISGDSTAVSSIVGGGNINGEITLGMPFLKYQTDWVRYSFDVEATYGMAADRSNFDIHSTYLFGLGYHASIDSDFFPGKVLLSIHLGVGSVEVPAADDNGYVSARMGKPNFDSRGGVIGMTFETMLPLNSSTYVVAGGRFYANADPNPWTAYIGISKELGSLRKIFSEEPVAANP